MAFSSNVAPVSSEGAIPDKPGSASTGKESSRAFRNSRSLPGFVVAQYSRNLRLQCLLLNRDQFPNARASYLHQRTQLRIVESRLLGRRLQLHKTASPR